MAQSRVFMNKAGNAVRLQVLLLFLAYLFQGPLSAGNECGDQPAGDNFNNAVIEFQTSRGKNRFDSYRRLLLSAFDCPAGSGAGILVDEYPVKKHFTYATLISWFGDPDFRYTADAGTKNWLGAGKDAAYYYLGLVQDGMAHDYYYAAIVLRDGEPESAATLYFPDRIEYLFPGITNRESVTTRLDLGAEGFSVFGIDLGASLARVVAQAGDKGIAVSKRVSEKWPDAISSYEISGALDDSDGARFVIVTALDDVIYSIAGGMRNRLLYDRLRQQLENEMHLEPDKQDRTITYHLNTVRGEMNIRVFDATSNPLTNPLMIGFTDAKLSAAAKAAKERFSETTNKHDRVVTVRCRAGVRFMRSLRESLLPFLLHQVVTHGHRRL